MQRYKESFTNKCPVENAVFMFVQLHFKCQENFYVY